MRNRKVIHDSDNPNTLPTIYNNNNDNSRTTTVTRRRRRRSHCRPNIVSFVLITFIIGILVTTTIIWKKKKKNHPVGRHSSSSSLTNHLVGFHRMGAHAAPVANNNNNNNHDDTSLLVLEEEEDTTTIIYDVIIIGSGPAGLTAAIFGARAGLNVFVLGSSLGGSLLSETTQQLENFPSFINEKKGGNDWLLTTRAQAHELGAHFASLPGLMVTSLTKKEQQQQQQEQAASSPILFSITTQLPDTTFHSKSVIIATGATPRRLNLVHEQDLWGKQIHNCAICDGSMYNNNGAVVVVVGGGDAAIDAAIYLSRQVQRVILIHRREQFDKVKSQGSLAIVKQTRNIDIYTPYVVTEWNVSEKNDNTNDNDDDVRLTGVTIQNQKKNHHQDQQQQQQFLACDGAFLMIGATPNTDWLRDTLVLDNDGLIQLFNNNKKKHNDDDDDEKESSSLLFTTETSLPGVFAAGEVTDGQYKQAITAAAAGAQAALDAERWLRGRILLLQTNNNNNNDTPPRRTPQSVGNHNNNNNSNKNSMTTAPPRRSAKQTSIAPQQKEEPNDSCDLTKIDCIQRVVHQYPVVVFSKPWCPYCQRALEALAIAGVSNPHVIDLSLLQKKNHIIISSSDVQAAYAPISGGRRTVPNVFIGGTSIGGGDETVALQAAGTLRILLEQAGAILLVGEEKENNDQSKKTQHVETNFDDPEDPLPPNTNTGTYNGCDLGTEECVTKIIHQYPLVLFSLSWCPECHRMFELLDVVGITKSRMTIIDLDDYNGNKKKVLEIRQQLLFKAHSKSVPSLFVGGEALGGFYKVNQLHQAGEFVPKLQKTGLV